MTRTEEDLSFQQLRVLDLLKSHIQSQTDAIATLENKAQNNFTIINIIVAIVAALNLELRTADNLHQIISERPLLLLIFVGYALVVVLSLRALVIRKQATVPMTVSVKYARDWSECELGHQFDILIRSYVDIYKHNDRIVKLKGRSIQWAYTSIGAVIAVIFVEALGMLPVLIDLFLSLLNILSLFVKYGYTAPVGITFVCVLFATNPSLRSYLLSQTRVAVSALVEKLEGLVKRLRR